MTIRTLTALLAAALLAAGCGSNSGSGGPDAPAGGPSDRLVNFEMDPPYVNGLDVDPDSGDFLLTTNRGFWRIDPDNSKVSQIKGTISAEGRTDTVGTFLEIEPLGGGRLIGSGHPDNQNTLPQFLGVISSDDNGRTWKVVSRLGDADLHKIVPAHGKLYAFDAVLGALLISSDGGKNWSERFTPRGLVIDFIVDPEDPDHLLAATEDQLYATDDGGERWRPVLSGEGIRLAWPAGGPMYRADKDGQTYTSTDGTQWSPAARVEGEPYKFETTDDPKHLYLALSDGSILETKDGAASWNPVFRP